MQTMLILLLKLMDCHSNSSNQNKNDIELNIQKLAELSLYLQLNIMQRKCWLPIANMSANAQNIYQRQQQKIKNQEKQKPSQQSLLKTQNNLSQSEAKKKNRSKIQTVKKNKQQIQQPKLQISKEVVNSVKKNIFEPVKQKKKPKMENIVKYQIKVSASKSSNKSGKNHIEEEDSIHQTQYNLSNLKSVKLYPQKYQIQKLNEFITNTKSFNSNKSNGSLNQFISNSASIENVGKDAEQVQNNDKIQHSQSGKQKVEQSKVSYFHHSNKQIQQNKIIGEVNSQNKSKSKSKSKIVKQSNYSFKPIKNHSKIKNNLSQQLNQQQTKKPTDTKVKKIKKQSRIPLQIGKENDGQLYKDESIQYIEHHSNQLQQFQASQKMGLDSQLANHKSNGIVNKPKKEQFENNESTVNQKYMDHYSIDISYLKNKMTNQQSKQNKQTSQKDRIAPHISQSSDKKTVIINKIQIPKQISNKVQSNAPIKTAKTLRKKIFSQVQSEESNQMDEISTFNQQEMKMLLGAKGNKYKQAIVMQYIKINRVTQKKE